MKPTAIACCLIVLGAPLPSQNQPASDYETVKLEPGWGVLNAMKKAGSAESWLGQVMIDNEIRAVELRRLPIGLPVKINKEYIGTEPSQAQRELTAIVLGENPEVADAYIQMASMKKDLERMTAEISEKNRQISEITGRLNQQDQTIAKLRQSQTQGFGKKTLALVFAIGLVAGLLSAFGANSLAKSKNKGRYLELPREIYEKHPVTNEVVAFRLASFTTLAGNGDDEPRFACPLCFEKNIMGHNIGRHLRNAHAQPEGQPENREANEVVS